MLRVSLVISSFTFSFTAHAGRPMVVDDATLTNPYSCQIETWSQKNADSKEYWLLPACNFTGNFELAFGGGRINTDTSHDAYATVQGKTLFKPLTSNDWGMGLSFGTQINTTQNSHPDWFANVPISVSFMNDQLLIHSNLGWSKENLSKRNLMTWGIGSEISPWQPVTFTAEIYGNQHDKPFYQLGLKHMLIKDRLQIDATYGDHFNTAGDSSFFSVGIVVLTNPFLPH